MNRALDVVVVTGVGRQGQVGDSVARAFALGGSRVALAGHHHEEVEARAAELRAEGAEAVAVAGDLTDEAQVRRLVADVRTAFGDAVHALVHAAGGFAASGPVAESDVRVWHQQLAINLTAAYMATRAFLPALRMGRGSIVYFASAAALPGGDVAGLAGYAAAKAGVLALMRAVAADEKGNGVRANALAPTAIRTPANIGAMGDAARYVPMSSVVEAVVYLAGATAVSGQVLALEG